MKSFSVIRGPWSVSIAILALAAIPSSRAGISGDIFAPDRLFQVEVKMDPLDFHALRISHRTPEATNWAHMVESPYEYYRADVTIDGTEFKSVGVRKKGFIGSGVSTRPSLKIKFNKFAKDQDFAGLDMMTLNNNNQDATHAQQVLSYNFLNAAGAISPRCNLARVIVNGEDLGIYSHLESIRKPFIKRHFGKSNGDLYEGYAGDFDTNNLAKIVHKWGKDDEGNHLLPLVEMLEQTTPVSIPKLEELLDLDGFITLWAAEVLIGHWDGYSGNRNNWYLYRNPESGRLHMIPWGADSVFDDPGIFIQHTVPKSVKAVGLLCIRLWELPEIRTRYRAELQRILDEAWSEDVLLASRG